MKEQLKNKLYTALEKFLDGGVSGIQNFMREMPEVTQSYLSYSLSSQILRLIVAVVVSLPVYYFLIGTLKRIREGGSNVDDFGVALLLSIIALGLLAISAISVDTMLHIKISPASFILDEILNKV